MSYSRISISIIFLFNGVVSALGAILSDRIYKRYKSLGWVLITVIISLLIISMGYVTKGLSILVLLSIGFLTAILQPISSKLINSMTATWSLRRSEEYNIYLFFNSYPSTYK